MKTFKMMLVLMMIFPLLTACPQNGKSFQNMTAKEKATWMLGIYNSQYEDYKVQAARTDLAEEQKELLREKKKILTKVYPAINTYAGYASTGVVPAVDLETMIVQNLEQLLGML